MFALYYRKEGWLDMDGVQSFTNMMNVEVESTTYTITGVFLYKLI